MGEYQQMSKSAKGVNSAWIVAVGISKSWDVNRHTALVPYPWSRSINSCLAKG